VVEQLSWESVLAWRQERHAIAQRAPASEWLDVVRRVCGLHAQVTSCAELTLWARVEDLDRETVAHALWERRTLVRTWAMRGTLHLLPADELALWVGAQTALKPRYETASWRKAFAMSGAEAVAVLDAIRAALDGPPLTRDELADAVTQLLGDARLGEAVRGSFGDDAQAGGVARRRLLRQARRPEGALHPSGPVARRRRARRTATRGARRRAAPLPGRVRARDA
jgi:hypothetical protein